MGVAVSEYDRNPRITPEERAAQIASKLASGVRLPSPEAMRNSGRRRTPEKRALLERIAEGRAELERRSREPGGS